MLFASSILAVAAALIHLGLSLRARFAGGGPLRAGSQDSEAADVPVAKQLDQSYYDLMLAVGVLIGVVLLNVSGQAQLDILSPNNFVEKNGAFGLAAITFGLVCMLCTSLALLVVKHAPARDVVTRGLVPAAGLIVIAMGASDLSWI